MRIALVGPGLYPFVVGGIEMALSQLGRRLAQRHDVFIIALRPQHRLLETGRMGRARVFFIRQLPRPWASTLLILLAPLLILAKRVHIINAHQALSPMVAATLAALLTRRPLVITCHASDIRILGRRRWSVKLVQKVCFRLADAVVSVSREIADMLVHEYGLQADKVRVIPNGYDEALIRRLREKADRRTDKMSVVFMGTLKPDKDPLTLLKAIAELREGGLSVRTHIIGDGPLRQELERFCRDKGMSDLVVFHGMLPHPEALKILASSTIFVLPSVEEGLPLALVEAMALGKAVIATDVGGVPELVRDEETGLLFKPTNYLALKSALERLLNNRSLCRRLGEEARRAVMGYSWTSIMRVYEELYYDLVC